MLLVKDLMSDKTETVSPGDRLNDALTKMIKAGCRHLPVVCDDALVGIITDKDLRSAMHSPFEERDEEHASQQILNKLRVADCMTPDPWFVSPDTMLQEAAELLAFGKFGAMPVVDDGELVGMISTIDFLKYYANHPPT